MIPVQTSQANVKDDLNKYVSKATMLVHSKETTDAIMNAIRGSDPVQKVANATVMVMQRVDTAARENGVEVQDTTRVFGGDAIVRLIVELGEAAHIFKMDEKLIELAVSVAAEKYVKAEISARRIDPKQMAVHIQSSLRQLPPKFRKEMQKAQERIAQTARQYNYGKGK